MKRFEDIDTSKKQKIKDDGALVFLNSVLDKFGDNLLSLRNDTLGSLHFPQSENHLEKLYFRYLVLSKFGKMQQIAIKLSRDLDSSYFVYAALTTVFEAIQTNDTSETMKKKLFMSEMYLLKRQTLLNSQNSVAKLVNSGKSFISLFSHILCFQEKYDKAIELLKKDMNNLEANKILDGVV